MSSREKVRWWMEVSMYKGTVIDELIASVELAEEHMRAQAHEPRWSGPERVVTYRTEPQYSDEMVGVA
jgi:hypothetical protein